MITIEEKLKLFTKIVYDKVDKENQKVVENFNNEFGNILEQKKQEFIKEANTMSLQSQKNIEKEKLHIISKARTEEKRIIMEKRKEIYEETIKDLINYAEGYTETEEYKESFLRDFRSAILETNECSSLDIYLTQKDLLRYKSEILSILEGKSVDFNCDDEITGGFIILDNKRNIKLDMSFLSRIQNSKDYIGHKLFEIVTV
jgi:vacuolar-type H+-ATPase subunit E/Vma4